ncbi:MAG: carbohydrate binding domain-containing protein [Acutalibacteraceae bacterium]|nr:carbohydrate binding domain-containing protein [Acutalibacteraceae bacterium]
MKIGKILKISISAILSLALIASIIVIPAVSAETTTDYNLIKNGDFESGTTDWYISSSDKVTVKTTSEYDITDDNHGKVLKATTNWQYAAQENIAVEPNTTYILKFDYYVKSWFGGQYKVGTKTSDLVATSIYYYAADNKNLTLGKWATITKEITTAENQTTFAFAVAGNGGAIFVDNIVLSKKVTITATAAKGGAVSGLPTTTILAGDSITLSAKANKGYTVDGWYNGDTKVSDSAIYSFTATENADLTAKFTVDPAIISDGGFEDETLNGGWVGSDHFKITTADKYEGKQSALLEPTGSWQNANYQFMVEKNKYYAVRFMAKNAGKDGIIKVTTASDTNTNILDGGSANGGNLAIGATSNWSLITKTFYSGDNTEFKLFLVRNGNNATKVYIDNLQIVERITVTATAEEGGTVTPESATVVPGDNVTVTATSNAGYWFDGWYYGDKKVSDSKSFTFKVINNIALTAKFAPAKVDGIVENGSFEVNHDNGWTTNYANEFTVVNAADEAPAKAIDGEKILKVTAAGQWHSINQNVTLEKNKEYIISFWYYRHNSGYISLKFGNSTADNGVVKESWLNNETKNKWVYKRWVINTKDDTTLKMILCAFEGTAYIDDIRIVETDAIGNIIENGDMSNVGKALNAWDNYDANCFSYDAEAEGYIGNGALKIVGDGNETNWFNAGYELNVKANTQYKIAFWAKNTSASTKMIYKITDTSGKNILDSDKYTNGLDTDETEWGYNQISFNTGNLTTIRLIFVERSNGTTYIDDIYLGEVIETDVTTSDKTFGTVSADKGFVGKDDEVTYTATATAGGKFLGWRVGDSEELVQGETYTYKGFEALKLTAVFEAALGNVNGDKVIDANDMSALRDSILGNADYNALGDMNANATNDIRDLVALYKTISK